MTHSCMTQLKCGTNTDYMLNGYYSMIFIRCYYKISIKWTINVFKIKIRQSFLLGDQVSQWIDYNTHIKKKTYHPPSDPTSPLSLHFLRMFLNCILQVQWRRLFKSFDWIYPMHQSIWMGLFHLQKSWTETKVATNLI